MALKREYSKVDDVPEAYRADYVEKNGKWVLAVEDGAVVDSTVPSKLAEFRDNNRKLQELLDSEKTKAGELSKRFEGIDPALYETLKKMASEAEADDEKRLFAEGKVDEVVKRRVKAAIGDSKEQLAAKSQAYEQLKAEHDDLTARWTRRIARDGIISNLDAYGVVIAPGMTDDLYSRIERDWTLGEGDALVPTRKDMLNGDGDPMKPEQYVEHLVEKAPGFFKKSAGGSGTGTNTAGTKPSGKIVIPANDIAMKGKYQAQLATGEAVLGPPTA